MPLYTYPTYFNTIKYYANDSIFYKEINLWGQKGQDISSCPDLLFWLWELSLRSPVENKSVMMMMMMMITTVSHVRTNASFSCIITTVSWVFPSLGLIPILTNFTADIWLTTHNITENKPSVRPHDIVSENVIL